MCFDNKYLIVGSKTFTGLRYGMVSLGPSSYMWLSNTHWIYLQKIWNRIKRLRTLSIRPYAYSFFVSTLK